MNTKCFRVQKSEKTKEKSSLSALIFVHFASYLICLSCIIVYITGHPYHLIVPGHINRQIWVHTFLLKLLLDI